MNNFLVCLDGSKLDEHIIRYSSMMAHLVACKKVIFIHAVKVNLDTSLKKQFKELISQKFDYSCETSIEIIRGSNASEILAWPHMKEIDLIVMGIKPKSDSTGVHAAKIMGGSYCSVLLVPTTALAEISSVLIPLDFSDNSVRALKVAKAIQKEKDLTVYLQHVFYVPTGYSATGKTYEEFAEIMQKNKRKEYSKFKQQHEIDDSTFEVIFTLDNDDKPSDNIYEMAEEKKVSMIVLGSTGKTKAASMLLRSTAIGLLKYDEDIPCLVVKNKEENIGFFQALLRV
ncbi:MAG: universal stress protein [Reichenbachiella sp.]